MAEAAADRPPELREGASRPEVELHIERTREALAEDVREIRSRLAPVVTGVSIALAAASLAVAVLTVRAARRRSWG